MTFGSVYIAGHQGLVGSALLRDLQKHGYRNIIVRTHKELDLRNSEKVREFFARNRPQAVIVAAARVGGIKANNDFPVEFLLARPRLRPAGSRVARSCWEQRQLGERPRSGGTEVLLKFRGIARALSAYCVWVFDSCMHLQG